MNHRQKVFTLPTRLRLLQSAVVILLMILGLLIGIHEPPPGEPEDAEPRREAT